jgi:hypothetical protein
VTVTDLLPETPAASTAVAVSVLLPGVSPLTVALQFPWLSVADDPLTVTLVIETVSLTLPVTPTVLDVTTAPSAGVAIFRIGLGSVDMTNALTCRPVATNKRPPPALGELKCMTQDCSEHGSDAWSRTCPVDKLRP